MKRMISVMLGKGSVDHNSGKVYSKNTDTERSHLNVEYCNEDIRDVYHGLLEENSALETINGALCNQLTQVNEELHS